MTYLLRRRDLEHASPGLYFNTIQEKPLAHLRILSILNTPFQILPFSLPTRSSLRGNVLARNPYQRKLLKQNETTQVSKISHTDLSVCLKDSGDHKFDKSML